MENDQNFSQENAKKKTKLSKKTIVLISVACVLFLVLIGLIILIPVLQNAQETEPSTEPSVSEEVPSSDPVDEPSIPEDPEYVMLEHMAELYAQNPDIAGWIRIDDTKIDYPVMYTPDDEEKYMRKDFEENYHLSGLPLIDKDCTMDPAEESKSLIIYGHNMGNGTAFGTLKYYRDKEYWEEHPTIYFSTLYEERTYEVVAAFYDKVYYNYDDVFKFYQFIDPETEEDYAEAIAAYAEKAEYDTGVTIEEGDRLITLVTCSYHVKDGRFVVVAREITEDKQVDTQNQTQE